MDRALYNLAHFLELFPSQTVLVVGDLMLDEYLSGRVTRISPEAPVPVVELQVHTYVPGGAANVAANVVALGGQAKLVGVIGKDPAGQRLREELHCRGINDAWVVEAADRPTTRKIRVVAQNQQIVRVDDETREPISGELGQTLIRYGSTALGGSACVVLSDYAKGVLYPGLVTEIIRMARQVKCLVIVDPKGGDYGKYHGATVVAPNEVEAAQASGLSAESEGDLNEVAKRLLDLVRCEAVLITRGEQGMSLFVAGNEQGVRFPTQARSVADVTGAGDTVVATFSLSLAAGATFEQAAQIANVAAGLVVGKAGTATVSLEELRQHLNVFGGCS